MFNLDPLKTCFVVAIVTLTLCHFPFFAFQGIILPQMYTSVAANIINAGVNYVLIISLKMGIL